MNKDLIIGLLVSVAVLLIAINPFSGPNKAPKPVAKAKDDVVQMEMPPLDEEKDEKVEEIQDQPMENLIAPPSLVDVPSVAITPFTQQLQPPPPPGMQANKGAINIPVNPPGANFGKGIKDLFDINNLDPEPDPRLQNPPH